MNVPSSPNLVSFIIRLKESVLGIDMSVLFELLVSLPPMKVNNVTPPVLALSCLPLYHTFDIKGSPASAGSALHGIVLSR